MIHLILGKQGSGKTLVLVKHALDYFNNGKSIYSNVHLTFKSKNNPNDKKYFIRTFSSWIKDNTPYKTLKTLENDEVVYDEALEKYAIYSEGIKESFFDEFGYYKLYLDDIINCRLKNGLVILDEIHLYLPARASLSKINRIICDSFLSMVRKKKLIVMGTTQTERKVDIRFREERDYTWKIRKFSYEQENWTEVYHNQNLAKKIPIMILCKIQETVTDSIISNNFIANNLFNIYDTDQIINIEGV